MQLRCLFSEAEYISFGNFSGKIKGHLKVIGKPTKYFDENEDLKAKQPCALNINVKPKYYLGENGFYASAILGVGRVSPQVADGADIGVNYGLEAGYEIMNQWNISGMRYRVHKVSIEQ